MTLEAVPWVCDVCATGWLERPVPVGIHGCPECGTVPEHLLDPEPRQGILGWLRDLYGRLADPTLLDTLCPAVVDPAEWAIVKRGWFDGTLRCSRCGSPVPGPTHPLVRIARR